VLIKLGIIIFGHAQLDSRTDSRPLRAEYRIVGIPHNSYPSSSVSKLYKVKQIQPQEIYDVNQ